MNIVPDEIKFDLDKKERLNLQLYSLGQLAGCIAFNLKCIQQDNNDGELKDLLSVQLVDTALINISVFSEVLDRLLGELEGEDS